MDYVFAFFAGLFITMVAVPPLVRIAGPLRLVDQPDWRKVHASPIPRVGGLALGLATVAATLSWVPYDSRIVLYLIAGAWVIFFGALDDSLNLNYKLKLLAQLPPVLLVIHAGITLTHLPFFGLDPAPQWLSFVVTVLFFLGVINAVNLVDGLDGLAGGCMMLSLAAIAFLAFVVDAAPLVLLSLILMGAILGFLNYNSHPARIFLGDSGSQFLGFSIATFAIMLTEIYHTALNPTLPFLLLGLPLADTAWVFFRRISQGKSPFRPDKQHLHHQLLAGGLTHGQAVSVIYLFQAMLVATGLSVPYGSDLTVMGLLAAECGGLGLFIFLLQRRPAAIGIEVQGDQGPAVKKWRKTLGSLIQPLTWVIETALSLFLLTVALVARPSTHDIATLSLGLAVVVAFAAVFISQKARLFTRIGFYVAGALAVYGVEPLRHNAGSLFWLPVLYLWSLALLLIIAILLTERERFQVSPQDLLVGFIALAAAALRNELLPGRDMGFLVIAGIALFYAGEYVISAAEHRLWILRTATVLSLLLVGFRGLFVWPA